MSHNGDKRYLGVKEVADYLEVSVNTIYSWCSQRKIPFSKIGGLNRFDRKKIDEWFEDNEVMVYKSR